MGARYGRPHGVAPTLACAIRPYGRSLFAMVQTRGPHVSVPSQIRARIYMDKSTQIRLKP